MSDHEHAHVLAGSSAIALGVGLGICFLAIFLMAGLSFYFHRKRKSPSPEELLATLNTTSPVRKLEEWWRNTGRELGSSEDLGRLFNCPVCLEDVSQTQEIRELPCSHVFHRGCLDEWFFRGHYRCPVCQQSFVYPRSEN